MTQLDRIAHMEALLDNATAAIRAYTGTPEQRQRIQPMVDALAAYYHSPQWLQDYEDDEAGRLPKTLKRGVLSQDAVYDLLQVWQEISRPDTSLSHQP